MTFFKPRAVITISVGTTEVEKRAVKESAESAYTGEAVLIEEPMLEIDALGPGCHSLLVSKQKMTPLLSSNTVNLISTSLLNLVPSADEKSSATILG